MTNTQLLVREILRNPDRHEWSIQGFGMLRMYLSKEVRLHIWHSAFRVPNVSDIHDHPWDFESEVVCGWLRDHEYRVSDGVPATHTMQVIKCGTGGGIAKACELGEPGPVVLHYRGTTKHRWDVVATGETYSRTSNEIHRTEAVDGAVTIVRRTFKADTEHARVFFPIGTEWVSAEPRPATAEEVAVFVQSALQRLT